MRYSLIVLNKENITDFSKARNEALKKARREWVLFVDDDEIVTEALGLEIRDLKESIYDGYYIRRKNYMFGRYAGQDKVLRLGRKDAGRWERMVHETWKIKGNVGTLRNYLIHNTAKNLHEAIAKINYYSGLHAKANLQEGKKSSLFKFVFFPVFKLMQNLFTGKGFVFAILHSFHSFLAWSKLWIIQTKRNCKQ